jgi:acetyl esterase/lipase
MKSTKHLLHPELQVMAEAPIISEINDENLAVVRQTLQDVRPSLANSESYHVKRTEIFVSLDNGPDVRCLLYLPNQKEDSLKPAYVHIHGGGYIIGSPEGSDLQNLLLASEIGIVIISVDYRLAPEWPIPAPLDDCYTALGWLHENSETLGIDRERIGIGGESAGGGLAAALAIKARDEGLYKVCWQSLTYPMLDDRTGTDEFPGDPLVGEFVWTRKFNQYAWNCYLADADRAAPQVPGRLEDYNGLPPTWMFTASLDLFRDENIDYAQNLMSAGVSCELVVYPGACHAFQRIENSELAKRYQDDFKASLKRGLSYK